MSGAIDAIYGQTKQITVGVASSGVTLTDVSTDDVLLTNIGSNVVFVRIGTATAAAVLNTDLPVLPNSQIIVTRRQSQSANGTQVQSFVTAIAAAAGNTLHITPVEDA
jgi:hypothetical protein